MFIDTPRSERPRIRRQLADDYQRQDDAPQVVCAQDVRWKGAEMTPSGSDVVSRGVAVTLEWIEDGVALATMTRGERMNTLTLELIDEMGCALDVAQQGRARAFIITGSGRAFSCGAHLPYFTDEASPIGGSPTQLCDNYLAKIALLHDRLEAMAFPTIAAINGFALGGGCEMALSCDFRVLAADAVIGMPEVKLGAIPGAGGVQKLARHVGRSKALEWILLASHVSADEAARFGLAYDVVKPEALIDIAMKLAQRLKALSPMAIAQAKSAIYIAEDADLRTARRFGLEALSLLVGSPDWNEGMAAFRDKRAPDFDR
jgi:enoyl-CoA hydratase